MRSSAEGVHLTIPVFIYGYDHSGKPLKEITRTVTVSEDGGFVELTALVSKEHPVLLMNMATGNSISCRATSAQPASSGKAYVEIHFALPSPQFWGLEFPLEALHGATQKHAEAAEA